MEENLPPGFRFHPTDEELITYYLGQKVSDFGFTSRAITDVDLNKSEPWDLPAKASMGEKEWYFFSLRDRKYPTGLRTNRATEAGYWKTTGKDKEIYHGGSQVLVGMKKTLVFYRGRAPKGEKTNWVMHEYRLENKQAFKPTKEEWVVCRIFQKTSAVKKPQPTASSPQSLDSPNCDTNIIMNEFGDFDHMPNLNNAANSSTQLMNSSNNNTLYNTDFTNITNITSWNAACEAASSLLPSLSWPSSLLNSNLSMNSLLLKALQLRSYQPRESIKSTSMDNITAFMPQGLMPAYGNEHLFSPNLAASTSTSKALDDSVQHQEQPFNLDSVW